MESMLTLVKQAFSLEEKDPGEFSVMKVSGMTFRVRCFRAPEMGHVALMTASGFFGLMQMDTLILNPFTRDMPLLSYDRIRAMGKDKLYLELYDTCLSPGDLGALDRVVRRWQELPDFDPGSHWYDPIKLPQSLFKEGKKPLSRRLDQAAEDFLAAYLTLAQGAPAADPAEKREKAAAYSRGLLTHGGPAADVFIKRFGPETTEAFFQKVLFGA